MMVDSMTRLCPCCAYPLNENSECDQCQYQEDVILNDDSPSLEITLETRNMASKLVNKNTNEPLNPGDIVRDFRGTDWILHGYETPKSENSSGRVYLKTDENEMPQAFYPSIIDAKIIVE